MTDLGIEFISVFGLPPVAFVELAAGLDCQNISMVLRPIPYNPHHYPVYDLQNDRALRRALVAALANHRVSISIGEGFAVMPGMELRETWKAELATMQELGVTRINAVTFERELQRNIDQFGLLAELAASFGIEALLEFVPSFGVADLATALQVVRKVNRANFRLLIDTMHVARSGTTPAALAAVSPDLIGYIQLCDAPLVATNPDYMDEAMYERLPPGEGELPLFDILSALPRDLPIGVEVPMRARADAGVGPRERLLPCVTGARSLLSRLARPDTRQ